MTSTSDSNIEPGGPLLIDFCGDTTSLAPGEQLSFGRAADLPIDDNPYLHRVVGQFDYRSDRWWLTNVGTAIVLDVFSADTRSHAKVAPGTDLALIGGSMTITFTAHLSNYELTVSCEPPAQRFIVPPDTPEASETVNAVDLPMTDTQLALVLALAEPSLLDDTGQRAIPPSKQAAARLGWSMTTFNRKLDNVCDKLAKAGVRGVKASASDPAHNRRERLVDYAVSSRLVTREMLEQLD